MSGLCTVCGGLCPGKSEVGYTAWLRHWLAGYLSGAVAVRWGCLRSLSGEGLSAVLSV